MENFLETGNNRLARKNVWFKDLSNLCIERIKIVNHKYF